jgi:hypothetical protein
MNDDVTKRVARAKELLRTVRHAAMATVNEDGSPHNSPFLFLHDAALTRVYWGSHLASQHSLNVLRTGNVFVVVYDALERGGLYIRAGEGRIAEGDELDEALAVHNAYREREGKSRLERGYYADENGQRMWLADISGLWVNDTERNTEGLIVKDFRREVSADDLLRD